VLPVGFCGLIYVWLHFQTLAVGYSIPALERDLAANLERERALSLEAAALAAPETIEARAAEELGMVVPEASQILFVERSQ
jgi:cell division protein FtsL